MWNIDGTPEEVRHKDEVLRRWCESVRRDTSQIERTANGGAPIIRDDLGEARRVAAEIGRRNGNYPGPDLLGPPERVAEHVRPFVGLGFRNFYFDMPAPFDDETLERLIRDVKPLLN